MAMRPSDLRTLVDVALMTREQELDCDACLERVAAYAEVHLAGLPTPEALRLVEEHLAMCGDCHEEFRALAAALEGSQAP